MGAVRVYRDLHPVVYRELVTHAEARGVTVPVLLEDLARVLVGRYNPDGTRREAPLSLPPRAAAIADPAPVLTKAGRARNRPTGARRRGFLDDPANRARFADAVHARLTGEQLMIEFGKSMNTLYNWKAALTAEDRQAAQNRAEAGRLAS